MITAAASKYTATRPIDRKAGERIRYDRGNDAVDKGRTGAHRD